MNYVNFISIYNININYFDEKLGGDMVYYKNFKFRIGWGNMLLCIVKLGKFLYIFDLVYL